MIRSKARVAERTPELQQGEEALRQSQKLEAVMNTCVDCRIAQRPKLIERHVRV